MMDPTPEQIDAGSAAVLANFHPPTDLKPTWHLNPEKVARAVLVAAAGAAPRDSGMCGGCRDLGPHRNVPNCEYYEPPTALADTKLPAVTRVTLAGRTGVRSAEHWDYAGVELLVQDEGRTLKVLPLADGTYRRNEGEKE